VRIVAKVNNARGKHTVKLATEGVSKNLEVPPGASGIGSSINGGEFLMLAVATCYCNDLYREAARLGIEIQSLEVEASADFEGVGLAATSIRYRAKVESLSSDAEIARLLNETDAVAEVHNTLRAGAVVQLTAGVRVSA
jgi:organic hydroperoxide reductase OsmC/OhrA